MSNDHLARQAPSFRAGRTSRRGVTGAITICKDLVWKGCDVMNTPFYTYVEDAEGREHDLFVEIVDFRRRHDGTNDVVIAVSTPDGLSAERLLENLPDKERERVFREAAHFAVLEYSATMRSLIEFFDEENSND